MNGKTKEKQEKKQTYDSEIFFHQILQHRQQKGLATNHMGVVLTEAGPGWAKGEIKFERYHQNPIGSVHGGVIFFLADAVGGTAACTRGRLVTTANGTIHYLNAAIEPEKLVAEAVELKAGKNLLTYEVYVRTETGKLISKATMEYYSLHKDIRTEMEKHNMLKQQ